MLDFAGRFGDGFAPVFSQKENRWYYIDRTGKEAITLPASCCLAVDFNDGRAAILLHQDRSLGGRTPKRGDRFVFIDRQGSQDRAGVLVGTTEFSKDIWIKEANNGGSRVKMFQLFLHQHKLVGLDKTALLNYLGPSDVDFQRDKNLNYRLDGSCLGDLIVAIECEGEKVKRYRYNTMPAGEWFDINQPDRGDWPAFAPTAF